MWWFTSCLLIVFVGVASSKEPERNVIKNGDRIVRVSPSGQKQYHLPQYTVMDGTSIIQLSPTGEKEYHKRQHSIKDGKICPVSATGQSESYKGCMIIEKR